MLNIFIALLLIAIGSDWEKSEEAKERRHQELVELEKKKSRSKNSRKKTTRTMAKDNYGRVIIQEIVENANDFIDENGDVDLDAMEEDYE